MTYENALPPCSRTEVPLQDLFNQYHFKIKDYLLLYRECGYIVAM